MKTTIKPATVALQILALVAAGCAVAPDQEQVERPLAQTYDESAHARELATPYSEFQRVGELNADGTLAIEPAAVVEVTAALPEDTVAAGHEAWESGEYESCATYLRAAADSGDAKPYDIYLLGLALWKQGELLEAETHLVDACWKMEGFARARVNLARVRLEQGMNAEAREAIDAAIAIDEDFAPAHNVLGRVLLESGDRDAAAELDESNPWPLNNLGYALLKAGDFTAAIPPLEEAVARRDTLAVAFNNLALAKEQTGDLAGALIAAERAQALSERADYAATATRIAALIPAEDQSVAIADSENPAEAQDSTIIAAVNMPEPEESAAASDTP